MRFIPDSTPSGGSLFGSSFLATFAKCPKKWFNLYCRPDPSGSKGITYRFTSPFLLRGRVFHEGLAAWYRSGCHKGEDTGEYQIEPAIRATELEHAKCRHEYESSEDGENFLLMVQETLRAYHDRYGPGAPNRDYPNIQVLHDEKGEPIIEREYTVDLGYQDYVFTSRVDLAISHYGRPKIMEHKTSHPRYVGERLANIDYDSQFTGECFVLAALFPDNEIDGVLVNVLPMPRSSNSKFDVAQRETTRRSRLDLEQFRLSAIDILQQIDQRVAAFNEEVKRGATTEEAAARWFPDHGTRTGECWAYKGCEFQQLCYRKGSESETLRSFRPRTYEETKATQEWSK